MNLLDQPKICCDSVNFENTPSQQFSWCPNGKWRGPTSTPPMRRLTGKVLVFAAKRPLQCRASFQIGQVASATRVRILFIHRATAAADEGNVVSSPPSLSQRMWSGLRGCTAQLCLLQLVWRSTIVNQEKSPGQRFLFGLACAKCGTLVTLCFFRQRSCSGDRPFCAIQGSCGWQREKSTAENQSTFMHSSSFSIAENILSSQHHRRFHSCGSSQLNTRFYQDIGFSFLSLLVFGLFETKLLSLFPIWVCHSTWPLRHSNPVVNRAASRKTIDTLAFVTSSQP